MKISICTPMLGGDLSPYVTEEIPATTEEIRLALVHGYDGPEIQITYVPTPEEQPKETWS